MDRNVQGLVKSGVQQVFSERVAESYVDARDRFFLEILGLAFFLKAVEILVVEDVHLLMMGSHHQNLGEIIKL